MRLEGNRQLAASPSAVWAAINDPEVLRCSLPGCERLERLADDRLAATVTARIGPMAVTLDGTLRLAQLDPPHGCRIEGEGTSPSAGFARGVATLRLAPAGDGTRLDYTVDASVGGKLAQLGARLIEVAAKKTADDFFTRLTAELETPTSVEPAPEAAPTIAAPTRRRALPALVWVPAIIALVIAMLLVVSSL